MLNFCSVRGFTNLFTMQRSEDLAKYKNENSYNEGAIFLKLCRDFPHKHLAFHSLIRNFAVGYEEDISMITPLMQI